MARSEEADSRGEKNIATFTKLSSYRHVHKGLLPNIVSQFPYQDTGNKPINNGRLYRYLEDMGEISYTRTDTKENDMSVSKKSIQLGDII